MDILQADIDEVRTRITAAAQRVGRRADDVTLVAVSKTVAPERIDEALAHGIAAFGESKVQEAKAKIPLVSSRARWHMIGHLQTNKARDAVELFELIHSVDSVKLAIELNKAAEHAGKTQPILLEINVSGESSKFGFKPEDLGEALAQAVQHEGKLYDFEIAVEEGATIVRIGTAIFGERIRHEPTE